MFEDKYPSSQSLSAAFISATVFLALALILTSFRLWFRYHIRRLWWDDFWVALALVCDTICLATMWLYASPLNEPNTIFSEMPIHPQSRSTHIISFWILILFYTFSIWFARLSIVFSIVRIVPPCRNTSTMVWGAGTLFICMLVYMFICKTVVCSLDKSWYHEAPVYCRMPDWVALSEVCTDALSDFILVILPLRLLWRVKLPANQKTMVLSVFSTSILVTVVSVVHTLYLMLNISFLQGATAQIEGAVSLIVCNLLVTVTFLYRVTQNGDDITAGVSPSHLTTVDLNVSGGSLFTSMALPTLTKSSWTRFSGGSSVTATHVSSVVFSKTNNKDTLSRSDSITAV